jgi:3'-phosphoadenosine 5'-phosphosulfate sulfotransferase (PAPS reductase)/FAD synthetase
MAKLKHDINLESYDVLLVNSSGGKDSQTMLNYVIRQADSLGIRDRVVVAHADLGKAEWAGTRELAQRQAESYGVRFEAVSRPQGDLLSHVRERQMWPSSTARYCTSDHKRGQIAKIITMLGREHKAAKRAWAVRILNCMGLRAQESPARAKKINFGRNKRASTQSRIVDDWLPILDWSEDDIWADIQASGVEYHPAYDLGMPRLSCVFCIFAPRAALVLAGKHNPGLLDEYVQLEQDIGHKFTQANSMESIRDAVQADETVAATSGQWNM